MKKITIFLLTANMTLTFAYVSLAQKTLELSWNGSWFPAGNITSGPSLSPQIQTFQADVSDYTMTPDADFSDYLPALTVTTSLRNQLYTGFNYGSVSTGLSFGTQKSEWNDPFILTQAPTPGELYGLMGANVGTYGPTANLYKATTGALNSTIDADFTQFGTDGNGGVNLFSTVEPLQDLGLDKAGRYEYGELVITFSRPVKNPVIHVASLGGSSWYLPIGAIDAPGNWRLSYFSTELELQTPGYTSTRLSGTPYFDITGNKILNNASRPNGDSQVGDVDKNGNSAFGSASGSVQINGVVSRLVYKVYVRGSALSNFNFSFDRTAVVGANRDPFYGDFWNISYSLEKPTQQITGSVYNDVDGLNDNNINMTAGVSNNKTNAGSTLYANLINSGGLAVASVPVSADGDYLFDAVPVGDYTVQLTTNSSAGTYASPVAPPVTALPTGWVNTGEFIGTVAGTDGMVNSISASVSVATEDIKIEVNFGIQRLPESAITLQASQPNPGGFTFVPVPAGAFQTSNVGVNPNTLDYDGGTVNNIIITAFPSNTNAFTVGGVTYTNGGMCPVGLTCTTWPGTLTVPYNNGIGPVPAISVDPIEGSVSPVISFVAVDNAGRQDATPGSVTLPLTTITLAGIVWNDVDGNVLINNAEGVINGTNTGGDVLTGNVLYANLVNAAGIVIATTPIAANGTYLFNSIPTNTNNLIVQLSTTQGAIGVAKQTATLPTPTPTNIWVTTGESIGGTIDGLANSEVLVNSLATNITLINFGIEQRPNTTSSTMPNQTNNQSDFSIPVPLTQFGGSDPDAGGTVVQLRVVSFPTNVNSISIDNIKYGAGFTPWPAQGVTVNVDPSTGQPTVPFAVDPVDGVNSVVITYAQIDNAGKEDLTPGTVTIPFTVILPITGLEFTISNAANCTYILDWKTRTETNTKQFEIEHRTENGNWSTIFVVAAKGNSTNEQLYRMAHQLPAKGINYYRIKVVDKDGQFSYSTIKTVVSSCNGKQIITVYPNPVREALLVKGAQFGDMIQVMNMEGKLLLQSNANGSQTDKLNTSVLINGMYLVKILSSDGSIYVVKLTKF